MDQTSFRQLLQTPKASSATSPAASSGHIRGSLLAAASVAGKKKQKTVEASQPAFKPRTLKKNKGEDYRDRAGERRLGVNNDFAQVSMLHVVVCAPALAVDGAADASSMCIASRRKSQANEWSLASLGRGTS